MNLVAGILLAIVAVLSALIVLALFVWAARKDGAADRAVSTRLGLPRRRFFLRRDDQPPRSGPPPSSDARNG
jgi:hypothetical protein